MTLKIDNIENSSGTALLNNGIPQRSGRIMEYFASQCDGTPVTVSSGTYTTQRVTSQQILTDDWTDVIGSVITYAPPVDTKHLIYKYTFSSYFVNVHAISHFKFFIDGIEVFYGRHTRAMQYHESKNSLEWTIPIGGAGSAGDTVTGRLPNNGWTKPRTLKLTARRFNSSNAAALNGTTYWDGGALNNFILPHLTLIAIR
jgi:hypothetical protein